MTPKNVAICIKSLNLKFVLFVSPFAPPCSDIRAVAVLSLDILAWPADTVGTVVTGVYLHWIAVASGVFYTGRTAFSGVHTGLRCVCLEFSTLDSSCICWSLTLERVLWMGLWGWKSNRFEKVSQNQPSSSPIGGPFDPPRPGTVSGGVMLVDLAALADTLTGLCGGTLLTTCGLADADTARHISRLLGLVGRRPSSSATFRIVCRRLFTRSSSLVGHVLHCPLSHQRPRSSPGHTSTKGSMKQRGWGAGHKLANQNLYHSKQVLTNKNVCTRQNS